MCQQQQPNKSTDPSRTDKACDGLLYGLTHTLIFLVNNAKAAHCARVRTSHSADKDMDFESLLLHIRNAT